MDQQWLNTYREEIGGFSNTIHSFAQGEIARKDYKGISGGFGSYAQRDAAKHMLRLRLPGGRVTPERLHFMAQAVQQYHVPFLKLTTCEAIQMHDLTPDEVPAIMEAAIPCGIITRGGGGDNPRNIQASPLTGVQPGEAFDVMPWAEAATEYLLSICRDIHMPRKLKVAFCNGVDDCVHTAFRDMGFVAQPDGTFKLYIAGGLGGGWRMGILAAESLPAEDVLYYIRGMITTFCQYGNYQNRARARTRFMQETLGPDELRRVFLENVAAAKADESLKLHLTPAAITKTGTGTLDDPRAIAQKQPGLYAVAYHPIGGRLIPEKMVQLDNLIELTGGIAPPKLYRYNRFVSATISAGLADGKTIGQGLDEMDKIAKETLDETFRTALTGDSKEYRESSSSLMFAFILAIVLIYLILAAQFESFKDPLIIMLTVPLAIAGALVFMYFGDITMNIFSQIGIIMLIGLVAKNGILIVEFANQKQEAGEDKMRAIKDASLQRLRPILMTSASTILGLIPLAFATGEGCNQRIAMGTAVVGGMLISTLLTMYIVPAIYSYVSTNRSKLKTE